MLQNEIVSILSNYDVAWDENPLSQDRIRFRIGDQPVVVSFGNNPERASELLTNKLHELGVPQKPRVPPPTQQDKPRTYHTVHRSDNFIAILCEQGLTIAPGYVLVLPLTRPETLVGMTPGQFETLVSRLEDLPEDTAEEPAPDETESAAPDEAEAEAELEPEPDPAPAPTKRPEPTRLSEPSDAGDILRFLQRQHEPMKATTIASWMRLPVKKTEDALRDLQIRGDVNVEQGFWRLASRASLPAQTKSAPQNPIRPVSLNAPRSESVPPQLARILVGMAYASKLAEDDDLTTQQVAQHLCPRDGRQYSARLPGAIEKGLVARGKPLKDTRGWHYRLTPKGKAVAKTLNRSIFEQDDLGVPPWFDEIRQG